jgi:hypothetical protein
VTLDPLSLLHAAGSARRLAAFIEDGALVAALNAIGDTALAAAELSVALAREANDPASEVRSTITHLQTAHTALAQLYAVEAHERTPKWLMRSAYADEEAASKDFWTCALLGACYAYLREPSSATASLAWAKRACEGYWGANSYFLQVEGWKRTSAEEKERGVSTLTLLQRGARAHPDYALEGALSGTFIGSLNLLRSVRRPTTTIRKWKWSREMMGPVQFELFAERLADVAATG